MNPSQIKKIAGEIAHVGSQKIKIVDEDKARQALTRDDVRALLKQGVITTKPHGRTSRARAKKIAEQKKKGRRKGLGKRKGGQKSRTPKKQTWMIKVRALRRKLRETKNDLKDTQTYRRLYSMTTGGYFRNKSHLQIYITDKELLKKK